MKIELYISDFKHIDVVTSNKCPPTLQRYEFFFLFWLKVYHPFHFFLSLSISHVSSFNLSRQRTLIPSMLISRPIQVFMLAHMVALFLGDALLTSS